MSTIDGRVRLRRSIQRIAADLDRHNALQGVGVIVLFGNVLTPFPDLTVAVEGLTQLSDEVMRLTMANLLVPDHLRLTVGDRIAMLPVHGDKGLELLVHSKLRNWDIQPAEACKIGYNGDIYTPGGFRGVEVQVTGDNEGGNSVVAIYGDTIQITSIGGASVIIDGINFKAHRHSTPSGMSGGAQT